MSDDPNPNRAPDSSEPDESLLEESQHAEAAVADAGESDSHDPESKNLGRATMSAGVYTIIAQGATTAIRMGGLMILARIISPADFGLIAKVASIVGLTTLIGDFGVSLPIIQNKSIDQRQLSGLFWVIIFVGLSLAAIVACMAPVIAWFYQDARVVSVALMSAATLVLRTPSTHHSAMLRRRLQFGRLAVVEISAALVSILVAIAFALQGFSYWALLFQTMAFAITSTIVSWLSTRWMPDFHFAFGEIKDKLKMGSEFTAGTMLNYLSRKGDNILIAKVWGEAQCGFYTKAYGLLLLPLRQIAGPMGKVAVPALSRLQDQPERYKSFFYKGCTISFVLQIPITIFAAFAANEIVLAMLGPKWAAAVPIFFALTPTLFISTTAPATTWVFLSRGDTDRWLKLVVLNSTMTIVAFLIGVRYGAVGVAWAFSIVSVLLPFPNINYCFQPTNLKLSEFMLLMVPSVVCSGLAWVGGELIAQAVGWTAPWPLLFLKAAAFFAIYTAAIAMTSSGKTCFEMIRPHLPMARIFGTSSNA